MVKAGKNLEILRTGWTYNGRVHTIGEVVPVPPGLRLMDEEEQQEYYGGRVFYRLTTKSVNIGPGRVWQPRSEPKDEAIKYPGYLAVEGESEIGGGAASFTPRSKTIPRSELPDDLPAEITKKLEEDRARDAALAEKRTSGKTVHLKKKLHLRKKGRLASAKATQLSARR